MLTAAVTGLPLLVMSRASLPAWLWLSGQWASGTFALLIIAVALWMLAAYCAQPPARDRRAGLHGGRPGGRLADPEHCPARRSW